MAKRYWLMKSEPDVYSWENLVDEGEGTWDGVRNHQAANNLRVMKKGDQAFFYHSNIGLEIVGIAEISEGGIMDPTDDTGKWPAVKLVPKTKLPVPITLKRMKETDELAECQLVRQSRLSVCEIMKDEWSIILSLGAI